MLLTLPGMEHRRPAPDALPYRVMHPGALLKNCLLRPKASRVLELYTVASSLLGQSLPRFTLCQI